MPTGINKIGINRGRFKEGQLKGVKRPPRSAEWSKKISDGKRGKKLSAEHRKKLSISKIGAKNHMWKGGISNNEVLAGRKKPENCEICNRVGRICYDHDHITGKFRGWICLRCNAALGMIKDSPEILIEMINYLNKFK